MVTPMALTVLSLCRSSGMGGEVCLPSASTHVKVILAVLDDVTLAFGNTCRLRFLLSFITYREMSMQVVNIKSTQKNLGYYLCSIVVTD